MHAPNVPLENALDTVNEELNNIENSRTLLQIGVELFKTFNIFASPFNMSARQMRRPARQMDVGAVGAVGAAAGLNGL